MRQGMCAMKRKRSPNRDRRDRKAEKRRDQWKRSRREAKLRNTGL